MALFLVPILVATYLMPENLFEHCQRKLLSVFPIQVQSIFLNFSCRFLNLNYFSNLNPDCSNVFDLRNLKEQVQQAFWFKPFSVWITWSSDLKFFENSRPLALNFKRFSWLLEHFFLTVGQNNFGNKIPAIPSFQFKSRVLLKAFFLDLVGSPEC